MLSYKSKMIHLVIGKEKDKNIMMTSIYKTLMGYFTNRDNLSEFFIEGWKEYDALKRLDAGLKYFS
jgi:hypothetical protein